MSHMRWSDNKLTVRKDGPDYAAMEGNVVTIQDMLDSAPKKEDSSAQGAGLGSGVISAAGDSSAACTSHSNPNHFVDMLAAATSGSGGATLRGSGSGTHCEDGSDLYV